MAKRIEYDIKNNTNEVSIPFVFEVFDNKFLSSEKYHIALKILQNHLDSIIEFVNNKFNSMRIYNLKLCKSLENEESVCKIFNAHLDRIISVKNKRLYIMNIVSEKLAKEEHRINCEIQKIKDDPKFINFINFEKKVQGLNDQINSLDIDESYIQQTIVNLKKIKDEVEIKIINLFSCTLLKKIVVTTAEIDKLLNNPKLLGMIKNFRAENLKKEDSQFIFRNIQNIISLIGQKPGMNYHKFYKIAQWTKNISELSIFLFDFNILKSSLNSNINALKILTNNQKSIAEEKEKLVPIFESEENDIKNLNSTINMIQDISQMFADEVTKNNLHTNEYSLSFYEGLNSRI